MTSRVAVVQRPFRTLLAGSIRARRERSRGSCYFLHLVGRDRPHGGPHHVSEAGEDVRVDAIRLRELARRFGKVAHLARVHHGHRQRRRSERRDTEQLIAAGALKHDQRQWQNVEPFDERAHATLVIVDGEPFCGRQDAHNQLRLCHVDANEHVLPPSVKECRVARPCENSGSVLRPAPATVRALCDEYSGTPLRLTHGVYHPDGNELAP